MTNDRKDVYSRVTDRIIADLERGVRTWMKPWSAEHTAGRISRPLRHTLTDHKDIQSALTAKAFALLMRKLHDKGIINDKDVDDLLLEVVT